jgi:hypothetical protein
VTEAEWLGATDPAPMLEFLRDRASDRKLRLFAVACCRRVWNLARDERLKTALDTLERYADGAAGEEGRREVQKASSSFRRRHWEETGKEEEVCVATELSNASTKSMRRAAAKCGAPAAAAFAWAKVGDFNNRTAAERASQSALVRDIFANPFRPVTPDPAWLTPTVVSLAAGIYAEKAFDRLPILADALQDAGCEDAAVLEHCRGKGPHARGCWVVDLLLGKT